MKRKSLKQMYRDLPEKKTIHPKMDFIDEVCKVALKSRSTVYNWLSGKYEPDSITKKVLSDYFNVTPEELFPID